MSVRAAGITAAVLLAIAGGGGAALAQPATATTAAPAAAAPPAAPPPTVTAPAATAPAPAEPPPRKPEREEPRSFPTLRVGLGYALQLRGGGATSSALAFDAGVGGRLGITPYFALWPEFGYASSSGDVAGGKYFTAGVGPVFGTPMIAVGWMPKVLLGDQQGNFGVGMRNAIVGSFLYDLVSVDLSHNWVHTGVADRHEARATVSVDVVPIVAYFFFTNLMSTILGR